MSANIKALLCDIEDSFNAGYLCQYSNKGFELLITTGKMLKIVVTTILMRACPCTCLTFYSCTRTGLNKVRLTSMK